METSGTNPPTPPFGEELVEVRKPTSLLIAQFFLFPLIIIAICVGVFLLFGYLTYDQKSLREYLNEIRVGGGFADERRWQAAVELASVVATDKERVRDPEFVRDVIAVFRSARNEDPRIRQYLALTLGHIGDKRAVPALVDSLNDVFPPGQQPREAESLISTLWALGLIGDNAAVPGVVKQLKHGDPAVRKVAAYVLGALKDPSASRDLQIALNDARNEVRWNAAMALAQMNDPAGSDLLMKLLDREYVEAAPDMTPQQKDQLRVNAVKCLAMLKHEPARDLIAELSRSDPSLTVRNASLEALAKF